MNKILIQIALLLTITLTYASNNIGSTSAELIIFKQAKVNNVNSDIEFVSNDKIKNSVKILSYANPSKLYISNKLLNIINNLSSNNGGSFDNIQTILTNPLPQLLDKYNNWQDDSILEANPNKDKQLIKIRSKIELSDNKPLLHVSVPLLNDNNTYSINTNNLNNEDFLGQMSDNISGYMQFKISRNIDMKADIEINENDNKQIISSSRRMKPNQINYIDKGSYGILLIINKSNNQSLN